MFHKWQLDRHDLDVWQRLMISGAQGLKATSLARFANATVSKERALPVRLELVVIYAKFHPRPTSHCGCIVHKHQACPSTRVDDE